MKLDIVWQMSTNGEDVVKRYECTIMYLLGRSFSLSVCVIVWQTNYVKPLLREPLLPGVWAVKMAYESAVVAFTQFVVTPLQFVSGANVSQQQAWWVWRASFHIYLWRSQMTAGDLPALLPCLQYTHLLWCMSCLHSGNVIAMVILITIFIQM